MKFKKSLATIVFGVAAFGLAACHESTGAHLIDQNIKQLLWLRSSRLEPSPAIEEGYINPSDIYVELIDQDKNGRCEVVLNYGGHRHLMKKTPDGGVYLKKYDTIAKNVPKH